MLTLFSGIFGRNIKKCIKALLIHQLMHESVVLKNIKICIKIYIKCFNVNFNILLKTTN